MEYFGQCLSIGDLKVGGKSPRFLRPAWRGEVTDRRRGCGQAAYRTLNAPEIDLTSARPRNVVGDTFDITLTAKLSGFSNAFKMFPFSTKAPDHVSDAERSTLKRGHGRQ